MEINPYQLHFKRNKIYFDYGTGQMVKKEFKHAYVMTQNSKNPQEMRENVDVG